MKGGLMVTDGVRVPARKLGEGYRSAKYRHVVFGKGLNGKLRSPLMRVH
jgi:hypothetical protein